MGNNLILAVETSGAACSVALFSESCILGSKTLEDSHIQSSMLVPMIEQLFSSVSMKMSDCKAVAVSSGPGSYTGLRVGVSTAKGLCYGLNIPLISVNTLDLLVAAATSHFNADETIDFYVPMIDARRMEAYQSVYNSKSERISSIEPKIFNQNSYDAYLEKGKVAFVGNAVEKFQSAFPHQNCVYFSCEPSAIYMGNLAFEAYNNERFEDVAYFEPFYLKDFVAGISKKQILR